jgi:hypothetical protein
MAIHDWSRVSPGVFHDFHSAWIIELRTDLNDGLLPQDYYALAERVTGQAAHPTMPSAKTTATPGISLQDVPPQVRVVQESDADLYAKKANRIAIRQSSDDSPIAIIEILSPGNKNSQHAIDVPLDKVWSICFRRHPAIRKASTR